MGGYFRSQVPLVVGSVIVVLLQLMVAPFITIGYAMPNFILAFVVVMALVRAGDPGYITPFLLGLIYDLAGSGPVGGMALLCVLATFAISRLFSLFDNDTLFVPVALIVAFIFLVEFSYGILMIACGLDVGLLEACLYRVLPCGLYDTVIALILLPIALRIFVSKPRSNEMTLIR